ncbi:MAG: Rho termination factor N-terminal domain-containing protein [Actinobacteria bacterium]|nr:Rho termination factor N-terminal domain-containing protein [Actinomycetota bacterium]
MAQFAQALVTGGVLGSLLALLAFGIVLTYRTTGIFNFAQGAIGMVFAFLYFQLVQGGRVFFVAGVWDQTATIPGWIALPLIVLVLAPAFGWFLHRILFRHLTQAETHVQIVSTIGLLIALQGFTGMLWSGNPSIAPDEVFSTTPVTIGTFTTPVSSFWTIAIAVALAAGLVAFMRFSSMGVRMRGVVDRADLAELVGVNSYRVSALSWGLSTSFAALAGILVAPVISASFDLLTLPLLVVPATAAAVIGRIRSLPWTLLGGLLIGIGQTTSQIYTGDTLAPILASSIPFLVLFGALLLPIDWHEVRAEVAERPTVAQREGVSRRWIRGAIIGLAVILVLPSGWQLGRPAVLDWPPLSWVITIVNGPLGYFGELQNQFTRVPGIAVVFLGLVLLVGFAGQISLAHASLAAIGAIIVGHFVADFGLPFGVSLVIAGLVTVVPGVILAWRAVRLSPLFLGLATLAFAALMTQLMFNVPAITNGTSGVPFERSAVLADPYHYYLFGIGIFLLAAALVRNLRRGSIGLALRAMRDSETAIRGLGSSLGRLKLAVFSLSAFLAGVGGAMFAGAGQVAEPTQFVELFSLLFLALAVVGGIRYIRGALIGAGLFVMARPLLTSLTDWISGEFTGIAFWNIDQLPNLFFGAAAIVLATNPGGIVEQSRDGWLEFVAKREDKRARRRGDLDILADVSGTGVVPAWEAPTDEAASGFPDIYEPTQEITLNGHPVTFPAAALYHRPSCLLARGKTPEPIGPKRARKLSPCPVCAPDPPDSEPDPRAVAAAREPFAPVATLPRRDDLEEMTRAELYELAQHVELAGRSKMSKADLIDALASYGHEGA